MQKKIQNAKSEEEIDTIMKDYKSKRNKILAATTAATITFGAALLFLKKGKSKATDDLEKIKPDYDKKGKDDSVTKVKYQADAETVKNDAADVAKLLKEYQDGLIDYSTYLTKSHDDWSKRLDAATNHEMEIGKKYVNKEITEEEMKKGIGSSGDRFSKYTKAYYAARDEARKIDSSRTKADIEEIYKQANKKRKQAKKKRMEKLMFNLI